MSAGDDEVAREVDLDTILHVCIEVVKGATSINVDEPIRRLDIVLPRTG